MPAEERLDVAVVGATGEVGSTMLKVLEERGFPVGRLHPVASRADGRHIDFRGEELEVQAVEDFDFGQVRLALVSVGASASLQWSPRILEAGCSVVDNSSAFRLPDIEREHRPDDACALIPEVNPELLDQGAEPWLLSCPNCAAIQLVVALAPLERAFGLERVEVASYQSVSGAGRAGVQALELDARSMMGGEGLREADAEAGPFGRPIAFNVLPLCGDAEDGGYTGEERKLIAETRHLLGRPDLLVNPTCARVGVFYGHSEAVHLRLRERPPLDEVRQVLVDAPGVQVLDDPLAGLVPTPLESGSGSDDVFVGRLRLHPEDPHALSLWVVADNIRKGAALNSVQIAEEVVRRLA